MLQSFIKLYVDVESSSRNRNSRSPAAVAPRIGHATLLHSELVIDLENLTADIAGVGMPFGSAYGAGPFTNDQTNAPQAIRDVPDRMVRAPDHSTSISGRRERCSCGGFVAVACRPGGKSNVRRQTMPLGCLRSGELRGCVPSGIQSLDRIE